MRHNPSESFTRLPPLSYPCFSPDATSLASKYLTEQIFNQLKDRTTASGFTLAHALKSGILNSDSAIGIYTGDAETYAAFAPILNPVIQDYHGLTSHCSENITPSPHFPQCRLALPNPDPEGRFILSTRIRLARNLADYPFTTMIRFKERQKVEHAAIQAFTKLPNTLIGSYHPINEDNDSLGFRKGDRFQDGAGINRDWPIARGVFKSADGKFLVWLNEEDHFRIISLQKGGDLTTVYHHLQQAMASLEKTLMFAWSGTLGYLTTCPTNLGTGMRAGVHIRLPKLARRPERLQNYAKRAGLQVRGTQGEKTEVEGGVFDISNSQRLGISENECCQVLHQGLCNIISMEESA